uniref:Uncharacterized protein n=1 Tax=Helianthus annuus TaxID=4232 RepID=A0A251RR82_HELAN
MVRLIIVPIKDSDFIILIWFLRIGSVCCSTQKCRSYGFRNDVFRFVPLLKLGFLFSCRAYCVQTIVNLHRT